MVKVLAFLLSVAASSVLQEEVDQTGLLQTSKHRSVARAHRWEDIITYDEYDCTALMDSKVWCPMDYFKSLETTFEIDKACVLNSIATLENDIAKAELDIATANADTAAANASRIDSEEKKKQLEECTQKAIDDIKKVKDDMDRAAADFTAESTELEAQISDLESKLKTVRDVSLKAVGILDPGLCKESLVQSGRRWGWFQEIVQAVTDIAEDVVEWIEETTCDALETHADKVCYKRVEAERKKFNDQINELKKQADSLSNTLTNEKAKLVEAESAKAEAESAEAAAKSAEADAQAENEKKHEELANLKKGFEDLLASHKTQLDSLKEVLAAIQKVLLKFHDEVGKEVFDVMLNAR